MNDPELIAFLSGSVRLALPIVFAAVGELVSERAGVLNVGLEGTMLTGAFAGALGANATGSPIAGLLCGLLAGVLFAAFQGGFMITLGANQLVLGIAASTFAVGLTTFLSRQLLPQDKTGTLPSFEPVEIPLLHDIPLIGPALFGTCVLTAAYGYVIARGTGEAPGSYLAFWATWVTAPKPHQVATCGSCTT